MKATFTLILACLMVISGTSHSTNSKIKGDNNPVLKQLTPGNGIKEGKVIDARKNHRFRYGTESTGYLKSAKGTKQKLDSTIYEYLDTITNQFVKGKYDYFYNSDGKIVQTVSYDWDISTKMWTKEVSVDFTYDASRNMSQYMYSVFDLNAGIWSETYNNEYMYDSKGNETVYINYYWNYNKGKWITNTKSESTYNAIGKKTLVIDSSWNQNSNQWENSSKEEYTYNTNGDKTLYIYYIWDESTNKWSVNSKNEYTYDAYRNMTFEVDSIYAFNVNNGEYQWISQKYELTYNANGNIQQTNSKWDELSGSWKTIVKFDFLRDTYGNISNENSYGWDETASQWVATDKNESTFNNTYSFNEIVWPYFLNPDYGIGFSEYYQEELKHMIKDWNDYEWDKITSQWILTDSEMFYYSPTNYTGIDEISNNELKIYPNPTTGFVVFELNDASQPATVELTDLQGKKVLSQVLPGNKQISVSQLKSGMYFYTLNQRGKLYKGKVVKE